MVLFFLASISGLRAQELPLPPANDHFTNAATATGSEFVLTADLASATAESFEPWKGGWGRHTAWWSWIAPQSGIYTWEVPTNSNPATLAVFRRDSFEQLTPITETFWHRQAGLSFHYGEPVPRGSIQAEAGLEYLFQVDVAQPHHTPGPLVFSNPHPVSVVFAQPPLPAPTNDAYASRIMLPGTNVPFGGSLFAASAEPYEPRLPGEAMQRTLWWRWTAPGAGTAIIRSSNLNVVPLVGVFQRGLWNQLELFAHSGSEFGNECIRFWRARPELRWDTAADATYDIVADRYPEMDATVETALHLEWLPAPPNDAYSSPQWLSGSDLSLIVSNTSATFSEGDDYRVGSSTNSKSVWFAWQAPNSGILQLTTNEPARFTDPDFVSLPDSYAGSFTMFPLPCSGGIADLHPLPPFVPVWALFSETSSTSQHGSAPVTLWRNVNAGREYRIGLDGLEGASGEAVLNLLLTSPPTNDLFANRIVLPQSAVQVIGRTFAASGDAGQPYQAGARSVWWEWRAPKAGTWALRINSGHGDNAFGVYRGSTATAANAVNHSLSDPLTFEASAGEVFQIGVYAKTDWGGNLAFSLIEAASPALGLSEVTSPWNGSKHWGLFVNDTSGLRYRIESSTNLLDWLPVQTNQAIVPQEVMVVDPSLPSLFFRTRLEP